MKKPERLKADKYVPDLERDPKNRWVTMSNALTRAGHGLSLAEKRVIALALSKLDSKKSCEVPLVTHITAAEYSEAFDINIDVSYEQLQVAADKLFERKITFFEPAFKRNGEELEQTKIRMRWVGEANYHKGEGWIELHWWPKLMRSITGLRKHFSSYQLKQATALRSSYSWKLLELLMRFKKNGWAEYTIEDFKEAMDAPPSLQNDFGQIKRRIIVPAVKELTEKDGWIISWVAVKKGRKVTSVRFDFMRDPQGRLF